MMPVNSKINAILILSYWICNYISLVHGNTLSEELAKKGTDDGTSKLHTPSSTAKESASSISLLDKDQNDATRSSKPLSQVNQQNPQPNQVTEEQTPNVVKPKKKSIGGLFYSLMQHVLGKLIKLKKLSKFEQVNSEAIYLFGALKRTGCVEDKTETIEKVTHYIRQSDLYRGRFKKKSEFGEQFDKIETTRNGDCFYSAVSLLFFGHENFARGLRAINAAHIAINQQFFMALNVIYHEDDFTWMSALDVRRFAESIEIIFLSNILCRHIKIYESGGRNWYQHALIGCESPGEPLHLHLHRLHFSALAMKQTFPPVEADTIPLPDMPPLTIL